MARRFIVSFVIFFCACSPGVDSQYSRYRPIRPITTPVTSADIAALKRTISHLEREVVSIRQENEDLHTALQQMNESIFTLVKLNTASQNAIVEDLTSRVDSLETNVDVIADQAGIEMSETELSRFLGNTEAQLVDLQMEPDFDPAGLPTIAPETLDDISVEQADLLGGALYVMNRQNEKLSSQVAALQHEVGTGATVSRQPETDLIQNRLNQLERMVVSQTVSSSAPKKGLASNRFAGVGQAASATSNQAGVSTAALSEDEQEALHGMLEDSRGGAVSMFSVARTGAFYGSNGVPKPVPYDMLLANKGGVYHNANGTFVSNIAGYYFITFTARTYDHKYLGINLMKNDESLTAIFSDKHGRNVMQTQSIIVHLAVGDRLWLRMPPSNMFAIHSDQYHLTTFTGFLLYPGDP